MILWNDKTKISKEEQARINAERKKNIVPFHRGFYSTEHASPRDEHYLGSPENRQMEQFYREQAQEERLQQQDGPKLVKKRKIWVCKETNSAKELKR